MLSTLITDEANTLRLFLAYLRQRATRNAIQRVNSSEETIDALAELVGIPPSLCESEKFLEILVKRAPALLHVVSMASRIDDAVIIPLHAIPSNGCAQALVAVYHRQIRDEAR